MLYDGALRIELNLYYYLNIVCQVGKYIQTFLYDTAIGEICLPSPKDVNLSPVIFVHLP